MNGAIFHMQPDGTLVEMREANYDSEDVLQKLIADYPNLLAGDQIDPTEPRRWLLISREIGIPGEEDAGDRWALDHLFLDQDAIPTLIEVKRSTDTRIRREVVGQMLDYAANAVAYWTADKLSSKYEATCKERGIDPHSALVSLFRSEEMAAGVWQLVATNLKAGRIRLVFVADAIPPELRRVIEFLNGQMRAADVLGVEIKKFAGTGGTTYVPRVLGVTAEADAKKVTSGGQQWDEASFLSTLTQGRGDAEAVAARAILDWAARSRCSIKWGKGRGAYGGFSVTVETRYCISVYLGGSIEVLFEYMKSQHPFDTEQARNEFREQLSRVAGVKLPVDRINKRPNFPLAAITNPNSLKVFLEALDWFVTRVRTEPLSTT